MAITRTVSNEFKFELGKGNIDFSSDTFKGMLMDSTFTFNQDTHGTVSDVSADEISSAGGYARATLVVGTAWNQDNTDNKGSIAWNDVTWTASGASFDNFVAVIIYDDTHASDVIVGCIALGQTLSVGDGNSFQLQNIGFELADV